MPLIINYKANSEVQKINLKFLLIDKPSIMVSMEKIGHKLN